jgi:hypothetical protein
LAREAKKKKKKQAAKKPRWERSPGEDEEEDDDDDVKFVRIWRKKISCPLNMHAGECVACHNVDDKFLP